MNVILFITGFIGFLLSTNESDQFYINIIGVVMFALSAIIYLEKNR